FVTHDRYFVDSKATRVVEVGCGGIASFIGNYEDFLRARGGGCDGRHSVLRVETKACAETPSASEDKEERRRQHEARREAQKAERKRQKELTEVEEAIAEKEAEQAELERLMADPELYQDAESWRATSDRYTALKEDIDDLYGRWEELHLAETG
ncbi:MAG: ABC transporter ATP-binding protein, partial [Desulfuromonadales bacterium]